MIRTIGDLVIDIGKVSFIHFGRDEGGQINRAKILLAPGQVEYVEGESAKALAKVFEVDQPDIGTTAATSEART